MVEGINIFREHFSEYTEQYVLIGGLACDLLMEEQGLEFRPTKDVDMVLIVEALTNDFANAFWEFIEAGRYSARQRSNGKPEFYRFVNPQTPGYPSMIELFARPGSNISMTYTGHLVPLHIDDDISSLSAILLNEAYYSFLLDGRTRADAISVLDGIHLIPMKMKAWLDLNRQKSEGIHHVASFTELFATIPLSVCGFDGDLSLEAAANEMRQYYSEEEELKYGALGIEVELIDQDDDWTMKCNKVDIPAFMKRIDLMKCGESSICPFCGRNVRMTVAEDNHTIFACDCCDMSIELENN